MVTIIQEDPKLALFDNADLLEKGVPHELLEKTPNVLEIFWSIDNKNLFDRSGYQVSLEYPDSLDPHFLVKVISGPILHVHHHGDPIMTLGLGSA